VIVASRERLKRRRFAASGDAASGDKMAAEVIAGSKRR